MTSIRRSPLTVILGACLCALLLSTPALSQTAKGEHAFKGVVQKIDEKAKSLTVDGENVPGWMMAMTMSKRPSLSRSYSLM